MLTISESIAPILPDILGIFGVVLILWYYFLLQSGKCNAMKLSFSVANMIGSIFLLISLWYNWNLSSVMVEVSWLFISLYGIIKYFDQTKKMSVKS